MLAVPKVDVIAPAFTLGIAATVKAIIEVDNAPVSDQLFPKVAAFAPPSSVPNLPKVPVKLVGPNHMRFIVQRACCSTDMDAPLIWKLIKAEPISHQRKTHSHGTLV